MTNPTSYTDEQVLEMARSVHNMHREFDTERGHDLMINAGEMLESLRADRQRLQAEVEALRNAISKRPEIDADDMHWFESAFSAWACGDIEGAIDGLSSAVNYFMPSVPDSSPPDATLNETKEAKS